jgi:hypothetical protein
MTSCYWFVSLLCVICVICVLCFPLLNWIHTIFISSCSIFIVLIKGSRFSSGIFSFMLEFQIFVWPFENLLPTSSLEALIVH